MEAVVVEMYEGDTTTLMDNLYRLRIQICIIYLGSFILFSLFLAFFSWKYEDLKNGVEKVVDVRGLRAITSNKVAMLATLDTQFLLLEGFKDLVTSGKIIKLK